MRSFLSKTSEAEATDRRLRPRAIRIAVTVAVAAAAVLAVAVAFDVGSGQSALCSACHEMDESAATWSQSAHGVVPCVACHEQPTRWYELPQRVSGRIALLSRDANAHWSGAYAASADQPAIEMKGSTPDEICLQCHDPNRKATSGYRILIDHVEHAKRNGSCVSCHVRTAHPRASRGGPLSLMGQCYTCHGTAEYPDASTSCGTCHPSDYDPVPAAHKEDGWAKDHGRTWEVDAQLCTMCHEQSFCTDCHGLEMPHPAGWVDGEAGHAGPDVDRQTCDKCHEGGEQLCSACHHTGGKPSSGTWMELHPLQVDARGASECFDCHEPRSCSYCHTSLVVGGAP
jgi:hypothetical protein